MIKARRADAASTLLQGAQFLERYFTENGRYDQDTGGTAFALPARFSKSPQEGTTTFYTITASTLTQTAFTLSATRQGDQLNDTQCGNLSLNHTGVKCINGGGSCSDNASAAVQETVNDCW
ncbi:MAG: type IV pilin protein [Pirellulales bacterium]|nr:type IV pilin protein [Pirellulales bacterium]